MGSALEYERIHDGHVRLEVYSVPNLERPLFQDAIKGRFVPTAKGELFGPSWATHWFKLTLSVPKDWKNKHEDSIILFNWNSNSEALIFTESGSPILAFSKEERQEWQIPEEYCDGNFHTFYVELACNGMFGNAFSLIDFPQFTQPPLDDRTFKLEVADLVLGNKTARALALDFEIVADAARLFPKGSWQKHKALELCNTIMDTFDPDDLQSLADCRSLTKSFLGNLIDSPSVYESGENSLVYGVGHCHIDTAWLWPYAETRRKIVRSWTSQLDLMEKYPEYKFVCSQAVQYQWLLEDYPEVFERLKKATAKGTFIPIGGSWVESDMNLPSGEAIARQFLYGQRFFQKHFGVRTNTFWLPDTFGYSGQLPQLCREAGMTRFLTQKLSWNNINVFPNTTFNWVGIDGSQVLCHMPPSDTYNSKAVMSEVLLSAEGHKNLGEDPTSLILFGYGDGGGGPTVEMMERFRRLRGLADTSGHVPRVDIGGTVDGYFDQLEKNTKHGKELVSWVGELYFEFHRGTYTTHGAIKKGNRFSEVMLHDIELVATWLSLHIEGFKYPKKELDGLWDLVLLNQFHDVLPGSCIELVSIDAREIYERVLKQGNELLSNLLTQAGLTAEGSDLIGFNSLPWPRSGVVTSGGQKFVKVTSDNAGSMTALDDHISSGSRATEVSPGVFVLENAKIRAIIEGGTVTSYCDLEHQFELIAPNGKGNQMVMFDDQPLRQQAWGTEVFSLRTRKCLADGEVSILSAGPLRASLLVKQKVSESSWIKTVISLDHYSKTDPGASTSSGSYLEFECEVEWHEKFKFLKVEFPIDVNCDYVSMVWC